MKNGLQVICALLAMAFGTAANAQEISFEKESHNFGEVKQHELATCSFSVINEGTEPLIISNVRGSSGCTIVNSPKDPIAPGKTGTIEVNCNTKLKGPINKTVSITSNATNSSQKVLRIKGKIK